MKYLKSGEALQNWRLQSGVTQDEVAKKLGYTSPQYVSNCERGISSLPFDKVKKIARTWKTFDLGNYVDAYVEDKANEARMKITQAFKRS